MADAGEFLRFPFKFSLAGIGKLTIVNSLKSARSIETLFVLASSPGHSQYPGGAGYVTQQLLFFYQIIICSLAPHISV